MDLFELFSAFTGTSSNEKMLAIIDGFSRSERIFTKLSATLDEISKKIVDFVENFPVDGLYQWLCSYDLLKIYWPPCLYLSVEQTKDVFLILSEGTDDVHKLQVEDIIQNTYNYDLITKLLDDWKTSVSRRRIPLLEEGIQCYFEKKYYACNTLLLSQIGGIIEDNDQTFKQCVIEEITSKLNSLIDEQKNAGKEPAAEKNVARRHLLINLQGSLCAFAEYFSKYLYSSGKVEPAILENVANRNKTLHGEYCEFGTKLIALKTIIALDLLINLPEIQQKMTEEKHNA